MAESNVIETAKLVNTTVECATQEPIEYGFNKYLEMSWQKISLFYYTTTFLR